jgi:hypothetical protein
MRGANPGASQAGARKDPVTFKEGALSYWGYPSDVNKNERCGPAGFGSRPLAVPLKMMRAALWFGSNTDITESKRAEEELRDADKRKDEFLAVMAS